MSIDAITELLKFIHRLVAQVSGRLQWASIFVRFFCTCTVDLTSNESRFVDNLDIWRRVQDALGFIQLVMIAV